MFGAVPLWSCFYFRTSWDGRDEDDELIKLSNAQRFLISYSLFLVIPVVPAVGSRIPSTATSMSTFAS